MKYTQTKSAPKEVINFIGINYETSKIDGNEAYPVVSKIYQRQDKTFNVDGSGEYPASELEQIFDVFMYCEV